MTVSLARPLAGLRVVDLTLFLPGPMLTRLMADAGATIIKVEPPEGDPARLAGPFDPAGLSIWFRQLNRGKDCQRLDLKSPGGTAALRALIAGADVLIEGFRPGVMDRLGFGRAELAAINPRLIACSLSAFGQTGPLAHHPAHDMGAQALGGFLAVNDDASGRPVVPGIAAADMALCLTGLSAILMALIGRSSTGSGAYIDAAMIDALLPWSAHIAGDAFTGGAPPRSLNQRSLGGVAFYSVYETADQRFVVLCGREVKFARVLLTALGRPDLIAMASADPGPAQEPLRAFLAQSFASRSRDEWVRWLADKDVAFAPVLDFREAFASVLVRERGLIVEAADGVLEFGPTIRFAPLKPDNPA